MDTWANYEVLGFIEKYVEKQDQDMAPQTGWCPVGSFSAFNRDSHFSGTLIGVEWEGLDEP